MRTVSVKNLGSDYRMGKTRLTAEVGSETLAKAREILKREQVTLDDALQEMLSHIVTHDTAPYFKCGEPNAETLQAMAEAEARVMLTAGTIADLFTVRDVLQPHPSALKVTVAPKLYPAKKEHVGSTL